MGLQVQTGDESTVVEHRRFAAVCWGPGDPATTMVMLNEHGQLVDMLYAGQLSGSIRRTRRNAQGVDDIFSDPAKVWLQQPSRIIPTESTLLRCPQSALVRPLSGALLPMERSVTGASVTYLQKQTHLLWRPKRQSSAARRKGP